MKDNTTEQTGKEMKTAREILDKKWDKANLDLHENQIQLILQIMEEYADQFRKPPVVSPTNDNYEKEIDERFKFWEYNTRINGCIAARWFRNSIHNPKVAEMQEEIAGLKLAVKEYSRKFVQYHDSTIDLQEQNAKLRSFLEQALKFVDHNYYHLIDPVKLYNEITTVLTGKKD